MTGENDRDYTWRAPTGGSGGGGTDATARAGVATNAAAIALKADTTDLQAAVRELGSGIGDNSDAIADISENEVRVLTVSGWDAGDNARAIHLAIYPPEAIGLSLIHI